MSECFFLQSCGRLLTNWCSARPGQNPQKGKLNGLSNREIVIELDNGIRLHFPRINYRIRAA